MVLAGRRAMSTLLVVTVVTYVLYLALASAVVFLLDDSDFGIAE